MRDTARVTMRRAGWSRSAARSLSRALLLAGFAAAAYLAISLLDGPASADAPPAGRPDHLPAVGNLVDSVATKARATGGVVPTPDHAGPSDGRAARRDAAAAGGRNDSSGASAGNAALAKVAPAVEAIKPATVPAVPDRPGAVDEAGTAGLAGAVDAVGAVGGSLDAVSAVAGQVLDPLLLPGADLLSLPRLAGSVAALPGAVVESIAGVASGRQAGSLAPATGSTGGRAGGLLVTPADDRRGPPQVLAAGSTRGVEPAGRRLTGRTAGAARSEIRPAGSGNPPPRQPPAPPRAADGHAQAGGQGAPDRAAADCRSAWLPETGTGAIVTPGQMQRRGRPIPVDASPG